MGAWESAWWQSAVQGGVRRRDRRSGEYAAYLPDPLTGLQLSVPPELDRSLASAERAIRGLVGSSGATDLDRLSRLLLRSEAIASSMIEGVAPSSRQVAIAELAATGAEPIRRGSDQAQLVAANITVIRRATAELAQDRALTPDDVLGLHRALVPPEHHGIRAVQNWIGGSRWHPLDAEFVPPTPGRVPELIDDLVSYMNGASHAPLVQAALTHAQFETIHPFTDGNGRTGRALVSSVLRYRGAATNLSVPISSGLLSDASAYFDALTAYREGDLHPIVDQFAVAAERAVVNATILHDDVSAIRDDIVRTAVRRTRNIERFAELCASEPAFNINMVVEWGIARPTAYRLCERLTSLKMLRRERSIGGVDVWTVVGLTDALDAFAARSGRRSFGG